MRRHPCGNLAKEHNTNEYEKITVYIGLGIKGSEHDIKSKVGRASVDLQFGGHGVKDHGDEVGLEETGSETQKAYNSPCLFVQQMTKGKNINTHKPTMPTDPRKEIEYHCIYE